MWGKYAVFSKLTPGSLGGRQGKFRNICWQISPSRTLIAASFVARVGAQTPELFEHYKSTSVSQRNRGYCSNSCSNQGRRRIKLWAAYAALQQQQLAKSRLKSEETPVNLEVLDWAHKIGDDKILVTCPMGSTGMDLLTQLRNRNDDSKKKKMPTFLALQWISDGIVQDLHSPLKSSGQIKLLTFDDVEGKRIFWHSAAHVLGWVLENKFDSDISLCDGPPLLPNNGFFYEMHLENKKTVTEDILADLQKEIKKVVKEKSPFERLTVTREIAREFFYSNPFKLEMLEKIPETELITLYKCGDFIDLCRGPHIPHIDLVKTMNQCKSTIRAKCLGLLSAVELTRCGASHWKGKETDKLLQRVYGVAFPEKYLMQEWKALQEEAKKRDHRIIGKSQGLFMFHPTSPGSAFVLPHGTRIFNRLVDFLRKLYKEKGYDEVMTPLIYKKELWEQSGHLQNYKDDMYMVYPGLDKDNVWHEDRGDASNDELFGLKPMNCPGHCLVFRESRQYSYRDLPVRLADFSPLHRNEASGALTGLTRVRKFHQDDAHIFCAPDQVQNEIQGCLDFIQQVYGIFGFEFHLRLSTRPAQYMGSIETWNEAEDQLRKVLVDFGRPWEIKEGDGAFYGPKIDVEVTDALKRQHQCATIQLDFQLPLKFNLTYSGSDGENHVPIMIHRAILGSFERILAILTEHTAGKWPLWMSPRQVVVIPISEDNVAYGNQVLKLLKSKDLYVDLSASTKTLNKRIREAQLAGYNYILVVGEKEERTNSVNVRTRDNTIHGTKPLDQFELDIVEEVRNFK